MKRGLLALKEQLLKKRFGVGRKPRRARMNATGASLAIRTRHVTADVSRAVWERDGGQCTFCSANGRRCSERHFLQLDHVRPYAVGGGTTLGNLRLRCRAHNLHAARGFFGARFMRASLRRVRAARGRARQSEVGQVPDAGFFRNEMSSNQSSNFELGGRPNSTP